MPKIFRVLFIGGLLVANSPRAAWSREVAQEAAQAVQQSRSAPHIGPAKGEGTQSAESGLIKPTWILAFATALLCAFTGAMWLATWKLARDAAKTGAENAKAAQEQQAVMTNQQIAMQAQATAMAKLAAAAEASSKATEAAAKITADTFELTRAPILGNGDFVVNTCHHTVKDAAGTDSCVLSSLTVGVQYLNAGNVVVGYQVDSMSVVFHNRINTNPVFHSMSGRVLPHSQKTFFCDELKLNPPVPLPNDGRLDCVVRYGREGEPLTHTLKQSFSMEIQAPNAAGKVATHFRLIADRVPPQS